MRGKGAAFRLFFMRFLSVLVTAVCLWTGLPLEAAAESLLKIAPLLEYQQIDAFVNADGSEKVALDGLMPANAKVSAEPAETIGDQDTALCSYDITILHNGEEYQPDKRHPIKVEISDSQIGKAAANDHTLRIWHILDNGERELIEHYSVFGDTVTFEAYGFSVYAIEKTPVCVFNFYSPDKDGNYSEYYFPLDSGGSDYRQILKDGECLTNPQLPAVQEDSSALSGWTFIGWFAGDANGPTADTSYSFSDPVSVSSDRSVNLYAVYSDCAYVIFHEQFKPDKDNAEKGIWPVVATRRGELKRGSVEIRTDDISVSYDGGTEEEDSAPQMIFRGWSEVEQKTAGEPAKLVGDKVTISDNLNLYPIFTPIRWLTFDSGEDGSYVAPKYIYKTRLSSDEPVTKLTPATRAGYAFDGWYTEAEGGKQVTDPDGNVNTNLNLPTIKYSKTDGLTLEQDTTLYAHWKPGKTHYTVAIWQQQSTDAVNGEKNYDYVASYSEEAVTGSLVTVPSKYKKYAGTKQGLVDYHGFQNNPSDDGQKQVASDGSTVLNVYYNRNVHTFNFYGTAKDRWGYLVVDKSKYLYSFQALYGSPIADKFNTDGVVRTWTPFGSNIYTVQVVLLNTMPDEDINWVLTVEYTSTNYNYYYYVEALDDNAEHKRNGMSYVKYGELPNNYGTLYYNDDFWIIEGFERQCIYREDRKGEGKELKIYSDQSYRMATGDKYYFYYTRNTARLSFVNSDDNRVKYFDEDVKYEAPIAKYVPEDPTATKEGYEFSGWFYDKDCTVPVNFSKLTMPLTKLDIYAGWKKITHTVTLDPNGGELAPGQYTQLEVEHGGMIEEYSTVTRDYVPSQTGDYYYYYAGENSSHDPDKSDAYYTTETGSGINMNNSYAKEPGNYRYANWYQVNADGSETAFNFSSQITEDITLRLHWKELMTYYVQYDPGDGILDNKNNNEDKLFIGLDGSEYADHASVVVTRTAMKKNQNFIGWKIVGDKTETVYAPGQSFEFNSLYANTKAEIVDGKEVLKRVINLQAVYQDIGTAKIVYNANGGKIAAKADLGDAVAEPKDMKPTKTYAETTATLGNLINNSVVQLSTGEGFSNENYKFLGWNTEPDGSGNHFDAGAKVLVDTKEPVTLYAEWEVRVYFDKNNASCTWDKGWNTAGNGYTYVNEDNGHKGQYYTTVLLNSRLTEPPYPMESSKENEMFWFWATGRYENSQEAIEYDFNKPVESEMTLYGYWDELEIPIHVVDSSEQELKQVDDDWLKTKSILVNTDTNINLDPDKTHEDTTYVNVKKDYKYAFACAATDYESVSDDKTIANISYDKKKRCVWLTYTDGTGEKMPSDCELYFVYFKSPENLPIGYVELGNTGILSEVTVDTAPKIANSDPYSMNGKLTTPLQYPKDKSYSIYSYAIGNKDAKKASDLHIITNVSNSEKDRPPLQFQNTWRGYQYSTDGGKTWTRCGYGIQPYVVYYPSKPVIVTLNEETIGLAEDMDKKFEYEVKVEEITYEYQVRYEYKSEWKYTYYKYTLTGNKSIVANSKKQVSSKTVAEMSGNVFLSDGQSEDFTLFTTYRENKPDSPKTSNYYSDKNMYAIVTETEIVQKITITQITKEPDTFDTVHDGTGDSDINAYTYAYVSASDASNQTVTFTNKRKPEVELHIALIQDGNFIAADADYRNTKDDIHIKKLKSDSITLKDVSDGLFKGSDEDYVLAGIIYGTPDAETGIISKPGNISTIAYSKVSADTPRIYDYFIDGDSSTPLGDQQIYYVYYKLPEIVYVEDTPTGLKPIAPITNNGGSQIKMNGVTVAQHIKPKLLDDNTRTFSQDGSSNDYYIVPPKLDGQDKNSLLYTRIGAGSLDELENSSADKYMELRIYNGSVEYRFSGSDEWTPFKSDPVIYVIYKEAGYDLNIKKMIDGMDQSKTYTLTIKSDKLKDTDYKISNSDAPDQTTIRPENKTITVQIKNGTNLTIYALPQGNYTLQETSDDNSMYTLSAKVNDGKADVSEDAEFEIYLDKDTRAELTNKTPNVAPTGYREKTVPYAAMASLMLLMTFWILRKRSNRKGVMSDDSAAI